MAKRTRKNVTDLSAINEIKELNKELKHELIASIKNEVKSLIDLITNLQTENSELKKSINNSAKEINSLQIENGLLKNEIYKQKADIDNLEQYSRRNSLRVYGLDESVNESSEDCERKFIQCIGHFLGLRVYERDIDAIHRVGRRNRNGLPRCIIVKFTWRRIRDKILRSRSSLKGSGISIAEDLTKNNVKLLKEVQANSSVSNAWTWNGNIYAMTIDGVRVKLDKRLPIEQQIPGTSKSHHNYTPMTSVTNAKPKSTTSSNTTLSPTQRSSAVPPSNNFATFSQRSVVCGGDQRLTITANPPSLDSSASTSASPVSTILTPLTTPISTSVSHTAANTSKGKTSDLRHRESTPTTAPSQTAKCRRLVTNKKIIRRGVTNQPDIMDGKKHSY